MFVSQPPAPPMSDSIIPFHCYHGQTIASERQFVLISFRTAVPCRTNFNKRSNSNQLLSFNEFLSPTRPLPPPPPCQRISLLTLPTLTNGQIEISCTVPVLLIDLFLYCPVFCKYLTAKCNYNTPDVTDIKVKGLIMIILTNSPRSHF